MTRRLIFTTIIAIALWSAPPPTDAKKAGMDAARLARIAPRMKEFVDKGLVSGIVTLVQRRGALAHFEAAGFQDIEAKKPMQRDSIFQIMSMTKPVTGVAVMMLADEGRLRVNDPVEKHLPEFRGQLVITSREGGKLTLEKPARPITIRDLMTHTSGMISVPPASTGQQMITMTMPLKDAVAVYAQQPLDFQPGTKWQYSNPGIATLGRIVEVLSGMSYEKFLETRIFAPLGMVDSHIFLPESKHSRLAPVYSPKDGKLEKAGPDILGGDPLKFRKGAVYSGPEHMLYSTAADLARFYQMMLNKGALDGKRILSPWAVEAMTQVHSGDTRAGHNVGTGFGLTWEVTSAPIGTLTGQSIGAFGHGGAFGTYGWVDPKKDMIGVFMIQIAGAGRSDIRDAFLEMAAASIVE
jgi:CubicO group peptidase (beta-lactamase class C family)